MKENVNISVGAFVAQGAVIVGQVTLKQDSSVWYNAVVRGDLDLIELGQGSNIQDGCIVHVDRGCPVIIGEMCSIGHGAILHGCTIGNNALIGMGAIILNGVKIGNNCIIGAGTLVTQNTVIPDNSLVLGSPGKIKREVSEQEIIHNIENAKEYISLLKQHRKYSGI